MKKNDIGTLATSTKGANDASRSDAGKNNKRLESIEESTTSTSKKVETVYFDSQVDTEQSIRSLDIFLCEVRDHLRADNADPYVTLSTWDDTPHVGKLFTHKES